MGLVIISVVTGGIVTSITSVLVVQENKLYGAQVKLMIHYLSVKIQQSVSVYCLMILVTIFF